MNVRRAAFPIVLLVGLVVALPRVASAEWPRPELVGEAGNVMGARGGPGGGGVALSLSALWPLDSHFSVGVMGAADDLGRRIGRLRDPNDGTDLGAVETDHANALGIGWRIDATMTRRGMTPFATGTWGLYRQAHDVRGAIQGGVNVAGGSLGAGATWALAKHHRLGLVGRVQQFSNGITERYFTVSAEWRWTPGTRE
jgi:hypothetical protein